MPNKDRTGPRGKGPKTGRGKGKCGPKRGNNNNSNGGGGGGNRRRNRGNK